MVMELNLNYTTPGLILERYEELLRKKEEKSRMKSPHGSLRIPLANRRH
jgi:hypothetical protein